RSLASDPVHSILSLIMGSASARTSYGDTLTGQIAYALPLGAVTSSALPIESGSVARSTFADGGGDDDERPFDEYAVDWLFLQGPLWSNDAPLPRENAAPTSDPAVSAPSGAGADPAATAVAET